MLKGGGDIPGALVGESGDLRLRGNLKRADQGMDGCGKPDHHEKQEIDNRRDQAPAVGVPYFFCNQMFELLHVRPP